MTQPKFQIGDAVEVTDAPGVKVFITGYKLFTDTQVNTYDPHYRGYFYFTTLPGDGESNDSNPGYGHREFEVKPWNDGEKDPAFESFLKTLGTELV